MDRQREEMLLIYRDRVRAARERFMLATSTEEADEAATEYQRALAVYERATGRAGRNRNE